MWTNKEVSSGDPVDDDEGTDGDATNYGNST
jgi:hypothetical protein